MAATEDVRKTIRRLYHNIDGYVIPSEDEKRVKMSRCSPTYGELTPTSVQRLLAYLELTRRDVFYDLGSGLGKVILQTAMTVPLKRCVGIELSASRCRNARSVLIQARKLKLIRAQRCVFRHEDFLTAELLDATLVYTCSTAFSRLVMRKLSRKLVSLDREITFVTLQDVEPRRRIALADTLRLDTTWDRCSTVYVYRVATDN